MRSPLTVFGIAWDLSHRRDHGVAVTDLDADPVASPADAHGVLRAGMSLVTLPASSLVSWTAVHCSRPARSSQPATNLRTAATSAAVRRKRARLIVIAAG